MTACDGCNTWLSQPLQQLVVNDANTQSLGSDGTVPCQQKSNSCPRIPPFHHSEQLLRNPRKPCCSYSWVHASKYSSVFAFKIKNSRVSTEMERGEPAEGQPTQQAGERSSRGTFLLYMIPLQDPQVLLMGLVNSWN